MSSPLLQDYKLVREQNKHAFSIYSQISQITDKNVSSVLKVSCKIKPNNNLDPGVHTKMYTYMEVIFNVMYLYSYKIIKNMYEPVIS